MRKFAAALTSLLLCASLASCARTPERKTIYAMDTAVTITAYGENADEGIESAEKEIYRLDKLMSRSNKNGDVYRVNESGSGELNRETVEVIQTALDVCHSTDGAFDLTVAPLMDAWGFFGRKYRVPESREIEAILSGVGYKNVTLKDNGVTLQNGARIDLGGVAKGYAAGAAAKALEKSGVESALISFGSTIQPVGTKPDGWKIALANPRDTEEYIAMITLFDKCVSTSGSYEQEFEQDGKRYHHIIDPSTGYPAESGLSSVSVLCDDPARADALSTALFVMGLEKAEAYQKADGSFEAVFITDENEVYYTKGMEEFITVSDGFKSGVLD